MKSVIINLSDDIHSYLEIRAAMDNKRLPEALAEMLTEAAGAVKGKYTIAPPRDLMRDSREHYV